jgi:hypothetical protein
MAKEVSDKHALKHGRYTAAAVADRREFAELLREIRRLSILL